MSKIKLGKLTITLCILLSLACRSKEDKSFSLPSFDVMLLNSSTFFNTSKIPKGYPIVLIFFSTDCEHCQKETEGLLMHMNALKLDKFYFASVDSIREIKLFSDYYKLSKYNNITLCRDYTFFIPKYFKIRTTPFMAIYDKEKNLKAVFEGEYEINKIVDVLNKI